MDKYKLSERSDIKLRFNAEQGGYMLKKNTGFLREELPQTRTLKELGDIPYCVIIDGKVIAGKKYSRKRYAREDLAVPSADNGMLAGQVLDGCIRTRK